MKKEHNMQNMRWSKEDLKGQFSGCQTLGEIIVTLEKQLKNDGSVLCAISVNGLKFDESDEVRFKEAPLDDIESLEIKTSATQALVVDATGSASKFISDSVDLSLKTSELLRVDEPTKACQSFGLITESLQWLTVLLKNLGSAAKYNSQVSDGSKVLVQGDWKEAESR